MKTETEAGDSSKEQTSSHREERLVVPLDLWLQWHGDGTPEDDGEVCESEVTWSREKIFDHDVRYVRGDLVERLLRDVMQIHADPNDAGHNQCDEDKCQWCEWASELFPANAKSAGTDASGKTL